MKKQLKILYYSTSLPPKCDGLALQSMAYVKRLVELGYDVLLTTARPCIAFTRDAQHIHYKIWPYLSLAFLYPEFYVANIISRKLKKEIKKTLDEFRPDIVHVTMPDPILKVIAKVCDAKNIPIITSYHSDGMSLIKKWLHLPTFVAKKMLRFPKNASIKCHVALTPSFKKIVEADLNMSNFLVSPACVNTEIFYPRDKDIKLKKILTHNKPDNFLIIYAGRFSKEKDIPYLLELLVGIKNLSMAFIGEGPCKAWQKNLKKDFFISDSFWSQEKLAAAYQCADVVITASEAETLCLAIIEAMACGIPVIAPRAQAFVDYIEHGKTGLLYDKQNKEEARQLVMSFINDKVFQKTIRDNLIKCHDEYSFEHYVDFFEQQYIKILEECH